MIEEWQTVQVSNLYEISNIGRIRNKKTQKIISQRKNNGGYMIANLYKNGVPKTYIVHRLVADVFLPKEQGKNYVNHRDEDKTNNSVNNLEWCDVLYNNTYGTRIENASKKVRKAINQYDKNNNFIRTWSSASEVEKRLKYFGSNICTCCKGRQKTAYGYKWKYKEEIL